MDIELEADNKMLDEIVVSSTRKDANVREMVMSVQKIDIESIKKIPS